MPTKDSITLYSELVNQVLAKANKKTVYDRLRWHIGILSAYPCFMAIEVGLAYAIRHLIKSRDFNNWDVNAKYLVAVTVLAMLFLGVFAALALYAITKTEIAFCKNISKITLNDETVKSLAELDLKETESLYTPEGKENIKNIVSALYKQCIEKSISGFLAELFTERHFDNLEAKYCEKVTDIVNKMHSKPNFSAIYNIKEECCENKYIKDQR